MDPYVTGVYDILLGQSGGVGFIMCDLLTDPYIEELRSEYIPEEMTTKNEQYAGEEDVANDI